ncbi:elongation factor-like GTPase 1 [Teleopsis dalmanni]|uniref:elongation factor-like GTPase 1 n=2 Tax=Teleopsis dalmanni TaxID=139649 RepID=UPI0018CCD1FF|nr:elongation factor-like GTPase 1 [Teleopsis dalmanni]
MPVVDINDLVQIQKKITQVRNICILAHVDHGKTTLADSLLVSNGIISQRMAGKLRYLDNRQDEQERGITMKSSSISLYYKGVTNEEDYLINLIDSPGHVDFSSEVSTAVRLCDGAIIVVDVVEGVCPQTSVCLQQTYVEKLKPVLVLNKIDRLILEKQMTPLDAYFHISQILEQVNAALGKIFASDVLAKEDIAKKDTYESALEEVDDSNLYFSPAAGNVIFCSAFDGWAFSVTDFAVTYAKRLNMGCKELEQVLWGDYYYNANKNCAVAGAQEKAKKPMFVQFVLENIWSLYDTIVIRKDKEKLPVIAEKLGIKLLPRDLRLGEPKAQIKTVLGQWLPVDRTVLEMVIKHIPPPNDISDERAQRLLYPENADLSTYSPETLALKEDFKCCDDKSENVIAFVSKMFPVHIAQLPQNKPKRFTEDELQARRDEVRKRIEERKKLAAQTELESLTTGVEKLNVETKEVEEEISSLCEADKENFVFIAFARVFSGTIKRGMKLYNLTPKHDPRNKDQLNLDSPYVTEVIVGDLYLFMGGELQPLDEVPAGNIVGIGGLENDIIKTATLSSTIHCSSFSELSIMATPILRVAIEPVNPLETPKLIKGLKLLNQADACVQVSVAATGEHVITTLGEVHVEKCVHDLEENYAKIKVNVSKPIVSFRETIVPDATVDMVNETIVRTATDKDITKKIVTLQTANKLSTVKVIALPLPQSVVDLLEKYTSFFKELSSMSKSSPVSEKSTSLLAQIKTNLTAAFKDFDLKELSSYNTAELVERLWALGPRNCGTNILLNLSDYEQPNLWYALNRTADVDSSRIGRDTSDIRCNYNSSFVNGFQLTSSAGPLCEEPMQGVCFVVLEWSVHASDDELNTKSFGPFSGQILTTAKEACKQAFQNQPQRLVSPMYSCNIVVDAEVLGKMYAVIGRRHGKILSGDLTQGSGNFSVMAILPVIESFNFAQEIRKQTSGLACPQLIFSHWEVIDIDPFWVPTTEEEITHFGEKADSANRAKVYMDSVRHRKGLYVDEKVVEHAEKQRTLSKKK